MLRKNDNLPLLKKRFKEWYRTHPDVKFEAVISRTDNYYVTTPQHHISPLWFVVNLMGDLVSWQESPTDWIEEVEKEKRK